MTLLLYGLVMLVAMTMAGIIGFAANIIALPFLSMFLPLDLVVSMLVLIAGLQSGAQAVRARHQIHWREVAHIEGFVLIGVPLGIIFLNVLPEFALKAVLSVFIFVTAIRGLLKDVRGNKGSNFRERPWHKLLLVSAGFLSGAYGCGGPLMIIYTRNRYREKNMFRFMQFGCGTFTMGLSTLGHVVAGAYHVSSIPYIAVGLIAVACALCISTRIVNHMNTTFFNRLVNVVLIVSSLSLMEQVASGLGLVA